MNLHVTNLNKPLLKQTEVKQFSIKPRENMYIEILRLVSLVALIIIHTGTLAGYSQFGKITNVLNLGTSHSFDIHFFAFITGIYTIGKGKDYFLRNLSRNLFVFALLAIVYLPIVLNTNVNHTARNFTWDNMIFAGSLWYLYAITIASLFLPLIKLNFITDKNIWFSVIGALISLGLAIVFAWSFTSFLRVGFLAIAGYLTSNIFMRISNKNKSIYALIISVLMLIAIFVFSYISLFEVKSVIFEKFIVYFQVLTGSIIVALIASFEKRSPNKLNWVVKHSYFIYEFHHLFQVLWAFILLSIPGQYDANGYVLFANEGWMVLSWVFVFVTSILWSFIATKIQYLIWEKYIAIYLYKIKPSSPLYIITALLFIIGFVMYELFTK